MTTLRRWCSFIYQGEHGTTLGYGWIVDPAPGQRPRGRVLGVSPRHLLVEDEAGGTRWVPPEYVDTRPLRPPPDRMEGYRVRWETVQRAASHTDAADHARRRQLDPNSRALVYAVTALPAEDDEAGITVDLASVLGEERLVEFVIDSGDHEVGLLRWRFRYDGAYGEPADALAAAVRAWLATEPAGTEGSLSQALDELPDQVLAAHGLERVAEPDYEQVGLDDRLLGATEGGRG